MMTDIKNATGFTTTTTTNTSDDFQCELFPEPKESYRFRAITLFCIVLVSLIGNGLVCYGASRRRKKPFSYHLVTNLAVAELIFIAMQPFDFVYNTKPYSWIFGDFLCHVINPLKLCTTLVITFTLATIAVYRCMTMLQPYRYRPSTRVAYLVIAISWIWGIALTLPDSVTRKVIKFKKCNIFICNPDVLYDYRMIIVIVNSVVPFITLVFSYSSVISRVRKHLVKTKQESIKMQLQSSESIRTGSSIIHNDTMNQPQTRDNEFRDEQNSFEDSRRNEPRSNKMMRLETDILKVIYLIILMFFLCYLPYNALFILTEGLGLMFVKRWHYYWIMMWYLNLLHTVPSALHPICYGANSMLLRAFCRCPCRRHRRRRRRWFFK